MSWTSCRIAISSSCRIGRVFIVLSFLLGPHLPPCRMVDSELCWRASVLAPSTAPSRRDHQGAFDHVPSVKAGAWQRNRFGFSRKVLECGQHSEIMWWSLASVVTEDCTSDDRDPPLSTEDLTKVRIAPSPLW